jgi:exo-1,4-beta-D-glucosaminidase
LNASCAIEQKGDETIAAVTVKNPTNQLAFFINLGITKGADGFEVAPCYWEDNDLALLPGESRILKAVFATADLEGAKPMLRVGGWNIDGGRAPMQ